MLPERLFDRPSLAQAEAQVIATDISTTAFTLEVGKAAGLESGTGAIQARGRWDACLLVRRLNDPVTELCDHGVRASLLGTFLEAYFEVGASVPTHVLNEL
eukprot:4555395-Alexandrium_andersonii.AAC.1